MKINTNTSNLYASQRAQLPATARNESASFSSMLAKSTAGTSKSDETGVKQTDFTNMTHQELRDWANEQIRNGNMSLDESRPFMAMSMHIPVSGGSSGEFLAADNGERLDFTQKIRAGIEGARSRNDEVTRKMLESAMMIIQQHPRQTTGIQTRA